MVFYYGVLMNGENRQIFKYFKHRYMGKLRSN